MKTKCPKLPPLIVKRGFVSIKIYHTPNKGCDSYTFAYHINGQRRRQTFAKLEKAKAEAERIATNLAAGQLDVAKITNADWACYMRAKQLADSVKLPLEMLVAEHVGAKEMLGSIPMKQAIEYYLKKHPKNLQPRLVKDVIDEMLESKRQDGLNPRYLRQLRYDLQKFAQSFNCHIEVVTGVDIDAWLRSLGVAARTRNNLRTSVQTLFGYAMLKKYLPKDHDELDSVPLAKDRGGEIEIFTPFEVETLLNGADEGLVPFLALGAFAGIRHAEIQRLDWADIKLDDNLIEIKAAKAKTASRRMVPILPNLKAWLSPYAELSGPVCVYHNVTNQIIKLVRKLNFKWKAQNAGRVLNWKHNGLRHSFISYRVAEIKNVAQVALEAGNSPQIIFSNYRELVRPADAQKWFAIMPKQTENIIPIISVAGGSGEQRAVAEMVR